MQKEYCDIIHIYFSTDKNYFPQCIVAITSMLENHKTKERLSIHILTSDLGEEENKKAQKTAKKYNADIDFIFINESNFEIYKKNQDMQYLSINTFFRFYILPVVPPNVKKIIYLDCDLIATGDISEFYNQNIDNYIAGVIEDKMAKHQIEKLSLKGNNYFNAGVLLINLKELRKTDFLKTAISYLKDNLNRLEYHDQDILNGIWDKRVKFLDEKFNAQSYAFLRMKKRYKRAGVKRIKNPLIIHYTGSIKPWQVFCKHKKASEWLKYQQLTEYKFSTKDKFVFLFKKVLSKIFYIQKLNTKTNIYLFGIKI